MALGGTYDTTFMVIAYTSHEVQVHDKHACGGHFRFADLGSEAPPTVRFLDTFCVQENPF